MARKKNISRRQPDKPFRTATFNVLKGIVIPVDKAATAPAALPSLPPKQTPDETDLFLQAMAGTRPLELPQSHDSPLQNGTKITLHEHLKNSASQVDSEPSPVFLEEIRRLKLEVTFSEEMPHEDELRVLPGNRLRQLKRGIISVESQLDLHGLTKDEALRELPRFLRSAQLRNEKAVLVITGKGNNSPTEPVLQQAVASWLRDAGRTMTSEFAPAPREMGGSGAFVIFLKNCKTFR